MKFNVPLFKVFMSESVNKPLLEVLHSGYIGEGPKVKEFEKQLSSYFNVENLLTVNSGTSALHLAYQMSIFNEELKGYKNIEDVEVISTAITCTATNVPILSNGAKIVWADVNPVTGNICPKSIENKITKHTKAISMVHWGGNPCEIEAINKIANKYNIKTIEDGAHSIGLEYQGQRFGNHSDFSMLSLQAIKHITSIDGGVLITKNKEDYERAKKLRWYGIDREVKEGIDLRCELDVAEPGYKFHMNDICATVGMENFKHIESIVFKHRDNASFYNEYFKNVDAVLVAPENLLGKSAYWLYTIHVNNRDELMKKLLENGIGASKVHARNDTHSMFKEFKTNLPNSSEFNRTHLCIPVGWWVTNDEREYIANLVKKFAK